MLTRSLATLLLSVAVLATTIGCDNIRLVPPTDTTGSEKAETRDFDLAGFTGVQASNAFVVQLTRADSYMVRVNADDNLWDVLDVGLSGSTLRLRTKPGAGVRNGRLSAVVTMPSLRSLDLAGATRAGVNGFVSGDDLAVATSGASTLVLENVRFGSAMFDMSGAGKLSGSAAVAEGRFIVSGSGTVDLSGSGESVTIDASGSSRVALDRFPVQTASVTLSGGSEARVNSRNIVKADLSAGSHLYYVGSPILGSVQTSGGATIGRE